MLPVKIIVKSSFYFFLLITFFACSPKKTPESKPSGLLPKDKMTDVLVDIHLAEGAADNRRLKPQQFDLMMTAKYKDLFEKHGITFEQFNDSYNYYLNHADQFSEIYTEVINKLTTRESLINRDRSVASPHEAQKDSFFISEGSDTL